MNTIQRQTDGLRRSAAGFTLIELLVVMGVLVILLGLLLYPVQGSFNFTRRVQRIVEAQQTARFLMERITRELADAAYVFDNSIQFNPTRVNAMDEIQADATIAAPVPVPGTNRTDWFCVPYAKIDLMPAQRGDDMLPVKDPTDGGSYRPPLQRGEEIPQLPLLPGRRTVRYFIGLRDPMLPYVNSHEVRGGETDNTFVLYRAEFRLYDDDGNPNDALFQVLDNQPVLNEPAFFYNRKPAPRPMPGARDLDGDNQISYMENWLTVARPVSPVNGIDFISVLRDPRTKQYVLDNGPDGPHIAQVTAALQLSPALITGDPASPARAGDPANESGTVGDVRIAPAVYMARHGAWTWPARVTLYRGVPQQGAAQDITFYMTDVLMGTPPSITGWRSGDTVVRRYVQRADGTTTAPELVFNISLYQRLGEAGCLDAMSRSQACVDIGDPFADGSVSGARWNRSTRHPGGAMVANTRAGSVNFAMPSLLLSPDGSPMQDYTGADVNRDAYGRAYLELTTGPSGGVFGLGHLDNVSIVPGSETILGPDQRPGPDRGRPVVYTRVPFNTTDIPLNHYRIQYTDVPPGGDPSMRVGYIEFNPQYPFSADDRLRVSFQFQCNSVQDVVKADYLTRDLMSVALTVRMFDPTSSDVLPVSLTTQVKLRNLVR